MKQKTRLTRYLPCIRANRGTNMQKLRSPHQNGNAEHVSLFLAAHALTPSHQPINLFGGRCKIFLRFDPTDGKPLPGEIQLQPGGKR